MRAALLATLCLAHAATCDRTINWYISIDSTNKTQNEANAAAVKAHLPLFSQLQLAWKEGMPKNGSLAAWDDEAAVNAWLSVYQPLNIPIVPVVVNIVNATTFRELYADPTGYANKLVAIGKKYNFTGFNFDYEPQKPHDSDAKGYAKFLTAVNKVLVANGFTPLSIWVAQWSEALNQFGLLADSGVQYLQYMETYGGHPMPTMLSDMTNYVETIQSARNSTAQAGLGLGPFHTDYWNATSLQLFINNATELGVTNLDVFRVLEDGVHNWPAPYWWGILEKFMNGEI